MIDKVWVRDNKTGKKTLHPLEWFGGNIFDLSLPYAERELRRFKRELEEKYQGDYSIILERN